MTNHAARISGVSEIEFESIAAMLQRKVEGNRSVFRGVLGSAAVAEKQRTI
jgi:hypothetical protein